MHPTEQALNKLLNLDYLVYSSHKTATQTLVRTLTTHGLTTRHCHQLNDRGLQPGDFTHLLNRYYQRHKRPLNVISVFREPITRHISSFFQGYGTRPLRLQEVQSENETIIFKHTISQLQTQFIEELGSGSLIGYEESIHEICIELGINTHELAYDKIKQYGLYETENLRLHIYRFDHLINNFEATLSKLTGKNITQYNDNISHLKWYKDKYQEFKQSLKLPKMAVNQTYKHKRHLIELMYSESYEDLLNRTTFKYKN